MKTIDGNLSYRKQFALKAIIENRTSTRNFDNCFEMGDGDEVVKFIIKKTKEKLQPVSYFEKKMKEENGLIIGSKDYKLWRKAQKQEKLIRNLKRMGCYNEWLYFAANNSYDNFKEVNSFYNFYLENGVDQENGEIPLEIDEYQRELFKQDKLFCKERKISIN